MKLKLALVDGRRFEASKGAKGQCPLCGSDVIAKCGDVIVHHWAHKSRQECDAWWENETPWHRNWKNMFPFEWQEVIHRSESGEKHIADVKTANDWVIEFQHSRIDPEEKTARNNFYRKLIWVVDGTRRKTDAQQFSKVLSGVINIGNGQLPVLKLSIADECRLLREWAGSRVPVFFDFMGADNPNNSGLWCLLPGSTITGAYVMPCTRESFIALHQSNEAQAGSQFEELMNALGLLVDDHQKYLRSPHRQIRSAHSQRLAAGRQRRR